MIRTEDADVVGSPPFPRLQASTRRTLGMAGRSWLRRAAHRGANPGHLSTSVSEVRDWGAEMVDTPQNADS